MAAPRSTVGSRAVMELAGRRAGLFRWRRLAAPTGLQSLELAPEYAVSAAFCLKKPRYPRGFCDPAARLDAVEQLQECDEACMEARELLSNWAKSKLQLQLTSDGEVEAGSVLENPTALLKYKQFDDLYSYLKHELESSSVQEYLQHLLQNEVVNCRIVENLRLEDIEGEQKPADPRITMELRHKQVKENRLRHQKALEFQRQEKALRKAILSEAKLQIQEEDRRKALKAKKEDEEIQREMVKLRKEMAEKRQTMAEAWRMKQKRQEKSQKLSIQEGSINMSPPMDLKEEEQGEENQRRVQELLSRIHTDKQRCMQRHFSAWFRLILEHRIEMEKARVLADWKCQQKVLRAWRNYTWAQKVEQEAQRLEVHLQDQNRKNQLSAEHNQRRLLRCCFLAWQHWSQAEADKRELQLKREETKRKMAKLLEAVSLGKSGLNRTLEVSKSETAKVNQHQLLQQDEPTKTCLIQEEPGQTRDRSCGDAAHISHSYRKPEFDWQITLKHEALSAQDQEHLTEEQKQQLQKQQELIFEVQENQRLSRAKEEAVQATAATQALDSASQTREKKLKSRKQSRCQNTTPLSLPVSQEPENTKAATPGKRPSSQTTSAHPIVKAMEERAIQWAERRRKLEEAKRQREEERLAQLKAEEEACQRKVAEEKKAQQEQRREEKRQQKLKELEKQRRLEKEQQLQQKARDHYEKALLRKLGMVPWKKLREQANENLMVAQRHHCLSLQRKCLMSWFQHTQERLLEKVSQAEDFFSHMLIRWCFRSWLKYRDYLLALEEKASTLHAVCLKRKCFGAWFDLIMEEKRTLREKLKIATEHCNKRLVLDAFKAWRQYPLLMKKEREREERRNQLRRRVAEILPDFQTWQNEPKGD